MMGFLRALPTAWADLVMRLVMGLTTRGLGLGARERAEPRVIAGALAQRGFNAVLCTRTGSMSEAEYVEMLLERQVSGMIFAGGQYAEADAPHEHYQRLLQYLIPDFVHVISNDRIVKSGGKELAEELEQKGYDWIETEAVA